MILKKLFTGLLVILGLLISGCTNKPKEEEEVPTYDNQKILVIGNSFSNDALTYFYDIIEDNLIKPGFVLGHLDIGGSSLEVHDTNARTNNAVYNYQKRTEAGLDTKPLHTMAQVLQDESWDIVTVQQVSGKSGVANTYQPYLDNLINFIKTNSKNKHVRIAFHMTWAYEASSTHPDFVNYSKDQVMMYDSIIYVAQNIIGKHDDIDFIIPSGTVIQNLRNSVIEDNLTRDGYHLNKIGQYAAGLTWIKYFFDTDLDTLTLTDEEVTTDEFGAIKEAVDAAILNPYAVTSSELYPKPDPSKVLRYMDQLYMLSIGNSFTADAYSFLDEMVVDIGIKDYVIAYLYIGGSSLAQHNGNLLQNNPVYEYRVWSSKDGHSITKNVTIKEAIEMMNWDIITVQQVSGLSGIESSYVPTLKDFIYNIGKVNNNPNTKFAFQMTWAYQQDSTHWEFPKYDNDQTKMYDMIVSATQKQVKTLKEISYIIPSGTAIQNLRVSVGDTLTRDGYHLNEMGQYTAGLMWIKTITNIDVTKVTFTKPGVGIIANLDNIRKAVNDANARPYSVS